MMNEMTAASISFRNPVSAEWSSFPASQISRSRSCGIQKASTAKIAKNSREVRKKTPHAHGIRNWNVVDHEYSSPLHKQERTTAFLLDSLFC